jgi:hypothetical protein
VGTTRPSVVAEAEALAEDPDEGVDDWPAVTVTVTVLVALVLPLPLLALLDCGMFVSQTYSGIRYRR